MEQLQTKNDCFIQTAKILGKGSQVTDTVMIRRQDIGGVECNCLQVLIDGVYKNKTHLKS